ncbi:MAG: polyhydroxyalkanoic acid system family protein [Pseudomonadota bacterium]|nr:polyhydroxyalkanoic acid system family protein [Pseudomonadota bacterium]
MANIHIKRKHTLPPEVVRARMEEIAEDLKKKLDADYAWEGDSLRFKRSGASGSIDMGDGFVELKIKLGMLLSPMKGKIEQTINKNIEVALTDNGDTRLT